MSSQTVNSYTFRQLESSGNSGRTPADVMARAVAEADQIREQARLEGYELGIQQGGEQVRAEAAAAITALNEAMRAISATREGLAETLTAQAGELAMLTAEHIIAGAIDLQPERIIDVVRGALRRLNDRHRLTVLVNPDDLEALSRAVGSLQAELGGIEHLDVQADRRIARGGAVAQTAYGEIDVSIATQLQSARELIAAALAGDSDGDAGDDDDRGEQATPAAGEQAIPAAAEQATPAAAERATPAAAERATPAAAERATPAAAEQAIADGGELVNPHDI
jgi:flagellar assembly protein FliH